MKAKLPLTLITLTLGAASTHAAPVFKPTAQTPNGKNVLVILVDDMQEGALMAMGKKSAGSKVITDLMDQSTRYTNCYTMGALQGALSMPSRAMLMTGRTFFQTHQEGQMIPKSIKTMPEALRECGYRTFATGKWHSDFASYARSFSDGDNIYFGGMHQYETGGHVTPHLRHFRKDGQYGKEPIFVGDKFSSEMFADAAVEFLGSVKEQGDPFFCYVAFTSPHDPHNKVAPYSSPQDTTVLPIPANFAPQHAFDNGDLDIRDELVIPPPRTREQIIDQTARYGSLIDEVGQQIARVLDALEASGQADNTIIVFAADNGLAMGQHGLLGKQSLYEHSIGVPMFIRDASQTKGYQSGALCYLSDIAPTIYDMLEMERPASVTTPSLIKTLKGSDRGERDALLLVYMTNQRAVVWNHHKYIIYNVKGKIHKQLFDLEKDPLEMVNLADDPRNQKMVDSYHQKLIELMVKNHDICDLESTTWWTDGHKIGWNEALNTIKIY